MRILRRGLREVIRVVLNLISSSQNFGLSTLFDIMNHFLCHSFSCFTAADWLFWLFSSSSFICCRLLTRKLPSSTTLASPLTYSFSKLFYMPQLVFSIVLLCIW
ncbi:hypothetical protein V6Z12_A10G097000 [Gossypium hirsutum]